MSTSLAVVTIAVLVVLATGVWPPFVAIESGSMQPSIQQGDFVVIVEEHRLANEHAVDDTGVVPSVRGLAVGYYSLGGPGDIILFQPNGQTGKTPVIHRAMFHVDRGENWYNRANPRYVGSAVNCTQLEHCPAPNAGFITLGDGNARYDQATWEYRPVKSKWVVGRAVLRIPHLGWIRLGFDAVF